MDYIQLETPLDMFEFQVIGWFPYETSYINKVRVPREAYHHIEAQLNKQTGIYDNKYTIVCKGNSVGCSRRFAMMFKDNWVSVGEWEDVSAYPVGELRTK